MKMCWLDKNRKLIECENISDEYLKNICYFLARGGGWKDWLTKQRIDAIFEEAYRRHISRSDILFNQHLWAYYSQGISKKAPRMMFTKNEEVIHR